VDAALGNGYPTSTWLAPAYDGTAKTLPFAFSITITIYITFIVAMPNCRKTKLVSKYRYYHRNFTMYVLVISHFQLQLANLSPSFLLYEGTMKKY